MSVPPTTGSLATLGMTPLPNLLPARKGHFLLESGHHGEMWLDLELLCLRPEPVQRLATEIASRLAPHRIEVVCGPLVEGAFVALMTAAALDVAFTYANRLPNPSADGLYPVDYRLPGLLRDFVRGKRIAIVNDVINAGSAVQSTFFDLKACGAAPVAIAALAILGDWTARFASENGLAVESIVAMPNAIWPPAECPLCERGIQLTRPVNG